MSWHKVCLRVPRNDVGAAEALLGLAGAEAVSLLDAADAPELEPPPAQTPLWPSVDVQGLFRPGPDLQALAQWLAARFGVPATVETLDERDWQAALRERFAPRRFRRLALVGADDAAPTDTAVVRLHMGFAFGTGAHPTTRLCVEWLERALDPGATVLDYGCGSGVLALAALVLGAQRAWAVDNDPQALAAARANAALNGAGARLAIGSPEDLGASRFDVVVANILAGTLIELAPALAAHTASGGRIVLTGVLAEQRAAVEAAYAAYCRDFTAVAAEGWTLIEARRTPAS